MPLTSYLPLPYDRLLDPLSPSRMSEPISDRTFEQFTALRLLSLTSGLPNLT